MATSSNEDADALYLSVDIDAADAAVAPGVSAVGVGGLSSREMIDVVRTVSAEPWLFAGARGQRARVALTGGRLYIAGCTACSALHAPGGAVPWAQRWPPGCTGART